MSRCKSSRADRGARRRHRVRQVDAHQPSSAVARAAAGHGLRRRRRRPGDSSCVASWCDWLRAAGAVSVFGHDRRKHRVRRAAADGTRTTGSATSGSARGGAADRKTRQGRRRRSRRATTPRSASAASRCPAARSSAPRSRARCWSIRAPVLDDALSAVDTSTEEEILSRLRGVMRQRTSIIVAHRISTVRDADQIFVLDAGASPSAARTTSWSRTAGCMRRIQASAAGRGAGGS